LMLVVLNNLDFLQTVLLHLKDTRDLMESTLSNYAFHLLWIIKQMLKELKTHPTQNVKLIEDFQNVKEGINTFAQNLQVLKPFSFLIFFCS
jgi:hypothetical protein